MEVELDGGLRLGNKGGSLLLVNIVDRTVNHVTYERGRLSCSLPEVRRRLPLMGG